MTSSMVMTLLEAIPETQSMKEIIDKLDLIKIKNSALLCGRNCQENERQATDWEKILAKDMSDRGLLCKIHKDFLKCNNKETT